jgi:hypothetical protein
MTEKMTAHAFTIVANENSLPMTDILELIERTKFAKRHRLINTGEYRVEVCEKLGDGLWFVDFGKIRQGHGPGAASRKTKTRGFDFKGDEKFCEETACLIDTNKNFMVVQFNFNGARPGTMSDYFSCFDEGGANAYSLNPKYDDDVLRKFEERKLTKSLDYSIDSREFTAEDKKRGKSLTHALSMADEADGAMLSIKVSAGRSKKRGLNKTADNFIKFLRIKSVENPHAVTNLKVGFMSDFDAKVEIVDLIAQRLVVTFKDLVLGADNRISVDERKRALLRAYNSWKGLF